MDSFTFHCPTKIYYRQGGLSLIGKILREDYSCKKALMVFGGHSLIDNGYYDTIVSSLRENGIDFETYSGIEANPDVSDARKAILAARTFKPDFVLACGGGSVIDCAKLICHGYYYSGNPLDFFKKGVRPLHSLPLGVVLTLSASGSEMSDSCVISDRETGFKGGFNDESNYPTFSLLDPSLTDTVSDYQTAIGLVDMFSHSFERYMSQNERFEPCDGLALSVMADIVATSKMLFGDKKDIKEGRRSMMLLGSLSHNGFTSFGKKKNFVVHHAEHRLSGRYPALAHGQGIALLLPVFLEKNKDILKAKILRMAKQVFLSRVEDVDASIAALKDWLSFLPIYHSFEELPFIVAEEEIDQAEKRLELGM